MLISQIREHVQTSLQGIANRAKQDKEYRFGGLYRQIDRISLMDAWLDLNKKAASGVDRITAKEYKKNLVDNLIQLEERLKTKRYKAKLVRRVYIPKGKNKLRPLGIPALEDRLVQLAVAKILNAIFEQDFLESSFGYRPETGVQKAVRDITVNLMRGRYSYIVDADIKGFFDNLNHDWLIRMLEQRINDKTFIRLLQKWLKAGILDDKDIFHPEKGTPQGGTVSPILSNIYLHYALDLWFDKVIKPQCQGMAYICRYADDFVCAFQFKREAENFYNSLDSRLQKFNLELSKEKTKIISFSRFKKEEKTAFDFVGFEFRWGVSRKGNDIVKRRTSKKKFKQSIRNFTDWIRRYRNKRINWIFRRLNMKLRGYYNFYGIVGNMERLLDFFNSAMRLLYKWLNRRSQRRSYNYKGFKELCTYFKVLKPKIVEKQVSAFAV